MMGKGDLTNTGFNEELAAQHWLIAINPLFIKLSVTF